jgi:hypothetical protein
MTEFAVSALTRKRAELAGEIQAAEVRLRELRANLAHVDATIRLFAPDYPIAQIAPKKPQPERPVLFEKGELGRTILDILRTAPEPMTVAQMRARSWCGSGWPRIGVPGSSWIAGSTRLCADRTGWSRRWRMGRGRWGGGWPRCDSREPQR